MTKSALKEKKYCKELVVNNNLDLQSQGVIILFDNFLIRQL